MVFVRAGLGNNVDDAAGDSTELHFVVVRLHLEFLNFVDNGGDRVGREGHFRIVNAVQHEIVAAVGLTIYGGKHETTAWVGLTTTHPFPATPRVNARVIGLRFSFRAFLRIAKSYVGIRHYRAGGIVNRSA